jgi:hypothetical protein
MKRAVLAMLALATAGFTLLAADKGGSGGTRQSVDLTIYNQNLSLIREERTFTLAKGLSSVVVPDIPATIDGTSVHFLSLTNPRAVRVLEQNYQYDLAHQAKLLERYLGEQVEFIRVDPFTDKEYTVTARLISTGYSRPAGYADYAYAGGMVAEVNGKIEINPAGRLVLPSLPEELVLAPQLKWLVQNSQEGTHKAEVSYLAGGLSWTCNYVALLDKSDRSLDLTGWVTITNASGTSFHDAGLKLVAGDVNIVQNQVAGMMKAARSMAMDEAAAAPQFAQTNLFEYKLYSLQRRTDVGNNETKQIELTSATGVSAKKIFVYDGLADQWRYWYRNASYRGQESFGQQSNPKVGVYMTFKNDDRSGLGIPLPKGKVRVYKRDDDGREQFIGEDEIDHTPKDEQVRLYLGNAFDIVGERAQKEFRTLASGHVVEETIEIKVRNHKEEDAAVQVFEHPWRWTQWEIVSSNAEWSKVDQTTLSFPVKIAKGGEKTVRYTIRYSW